MSHYYYVLRTPAHALHKSVVSGKMNIQEYVASGLSTELNNGQVRLISGVGSDLPFGQCTDDLLKQAINNLESHFSVVGLTERFNQTILLMSQQLEWQKTPYYIQRNVAKDGMSGKQLEPETQNIIRQYNALDEALYKFVLEKFEQTVAKDLPIEVQQRFEYFNLLYRPYGLATLQIKSGFAQSGKTSKLDFVHLSRITNCIDQTVKKRPWYFYNIWFCGGPACS
ncbi:MAG: hypothetical protein IPJ90_00420 [Anaerolineaceae bacterium]|nr:hypothetical protein [Anaerolineaceae bacterium]